MTGFVEILGVYIFVIIGFAAKRWSHPSLSESTLVALSVYYFQPILIFWGILVKPLQWEYILVPLIFIGIMMIGLLVIYPLRFLFKDPKDQAVLSIASIVGNTGNLGIPLGILIAGPASVPYTSMINLFNALFVYTAGVYGYSRGTKGIKESVINVFKLPLVWAALAAFAVQLTQIPISNTLLQCLEMGAYATIVFQLLISGIFISQIQKTSIDVSLVSTSTLIKCIGLPLLGSFILSFCTHWLSPLASALLLLQLMMPTAANNLNFASLYECKPEKVAAISLLTILGSLIIFGLFRPLFNI